MQFFSFKVPLIQIFDSHYSNLLTRLLHVLNNFQNTCLVLNSISLSTTFFYMSLSLNSCELQSNTMWSITLMCTNHTIFFVNNTAILIHIRFSISKTKQTMACFSLLIQFYFTLCSNSLQYNIKYVKGNGMTLR